jgi:peptidyl-tRNA hydrolase
MFLFCYNYDMKKSRLKMYIVLRWDLSPAGAVVAASHASLGTYLTFLENPLMQEWQKTSFVKCVLKARSYEEFQFLKTVSTNRVFTESTLDNLEVSIGYDINENLTWILKDIPLWS